MVLQEMLEVHRNRDDKQAKAQAAARSSNAVECQPNIAAPLLRDEKARRDWVERELDICCQVILAMLHVPVIPTSGPNKAPRKRSMTSTILCLPNAAWLLPGHL